MIRYDARGYGRSPAPAAPFTQFGDLDYAMVRDCGGRIAAAIPGCGLIVLPGADHLLPLRAPGALADIIGELAR